jgi:hypothetical protein
MNMKKMNDAVQANEAKAVDAEALKKALNVRTNVRAGSLLSLKGPECDACGRGP